MRPKFIPHPDGGKMLAPLEYPDAYEMTLDEVKEYFVKNAPFSEQRAKLFRTFQTYCNMLWLYIPESIIWINGGFCTIKSWAAPEDIDIAFSIPEQYHDRLKNDPFFYSELLPLITRVVTDEMTGKKTKIAPLNGEIDAYSVMQGLPPIEHPELGLVTQEQKWHNWWSKIKMKDGSTNPTITKGFIKVVNPWTL